MTSFFSLIYILSIIAYEIHRMVDDMGSGCRESSIAKTKLGSIQVQPIQLIACLHHLDGVIYSSTATSFLVDSLIVAHAFWQKIRELLPTKKVQKGGGERRRKKNSSSKRAN